MKKLFLIAIVIFLVCLVGPAIFIAKFNINSYKPLITKQLEVALGNPVEIGTLSLKWSGGLTLGVDSLKIFTQEGDKRDIAISADNITAKLQLLGLLQKKFHISALSFENPVLSITRTKEGLVKVRGVEPKEAAPAGKKAEAAPVVPFLVDRFEIKRGNVRFEDMTMTPPINMKLDKLDVLLENVSLRGPVALDIKAALFSNIQNIAMKGSIGGFSTAPMYFKNLSLDLNLDSLDYQSLVKAVPSLQAAQLGEKFSGDLKININDLKINTGKITTLQGKITFDKGSLLVGAQKIPIEDIALNADLGESRITINNLSTRIVNALIKASGTIDNYQEIPKTSLKFSAETPQLKEVLMSILGKKGYIDGKFALNFEGLMNGKTWPDISQSMTGDGSFSLENGMLLNMNIVKQSLEALPMFPGLLGLIEQRLSPQEQEALSKEHTILKPIKQTFTISDGNIILENFNMSSDFIDFEGATNISLGGTISGKGKLLFSKSFSSAMVAVVEMIGVLENDQGQVEFPISFTSGPEGSIVAPNIKYIASKIAVTKGAELISDLMKRLDPQTTEAPATTGTPVTTETQQAPQGSTTETTNPLLQKIFGQ